MENDRGFHLNLRSNLSLWSQAPPSTKRIISRGLTWKWSAGPSSLKFPSLNGVMKPSLDPLVNDFIRKGAVVKVDPQPCFLSRIFSVPKTPTEERLIIDLSNLNKFLSCPTFKMYGIRELRSSLPLGAYFTSIDLKSAFLHIPIHPRFQKYLAFDHNGSLYFFRALPFGFSLSPLIFTRVCAYPFRLLRNQGIRTSVFIDDWLLWHTNQSILITDTSEAISLLQGLGFVINFKKSSLKPSQRIIHLDAICDRVAGTITPAPRQITTLRSNLRTLLAKFSTRNLQKALGCISFAAPLTHQGLFRLREFIRLSRGTRLTISSDFRTSILWWMKESECFTPTPWRNPPASLTLWTDASVQAWGAVTSTNLTISKRWTKAHHALHISHKEALAILLALRELDLQPNSSIIVRSDSKAACSLVNKQGSNRSDKLAIIAKMLVSFLEQKQLFLKAVHLPGHLNTWADSLSRTEPVATEWCLSERSFRNLPQLEQPLQIDLFAHPGNTKLPTFGCPFRHPQVTVVDALTSDWNNWTSIYLFPPRNLLPKVLEKLATYRGQGILIVPFVPLAPWWTLIPSQAKPLATELEIYQEVLGKIVILSSETSPPYRAFSF